MSLKVMVTLHNLYIGSNIGAIFRKTQLYLKAALTDQIINNTSEAIILMYVFDNPGTIQDDIANGLSIDKSVVARSIKSLVEIGYLIRKEDKSNQRVKKVYVTEAAEDFKHYWDKVVYQWEQVILANLSSDERNIVLNANLKIKESTISADILETLDKINKDNIR
jgi:DNA-binding MarR family transcriptional regulator